jgi:transposase InsO family protein
VRVAAVALARWCRRRGIGQEQVAEKLGLRPSTLGRWERRWREDRMGWKPRGRPPERAEREMRLSILALFGVLGPGVGLPTLRAIFPEVARSELIELQRHCRHAYRHRRKWMVHVLKWTRPGSVWAMDFSDPPAAIDGLYRRIFCVRDLPSGCQLLGLPCPEKSAEIVVRALEALRRWCGLPLALKCDNDSVFRSDEVKDWAREHGVLLLFSPVETPEYNGSIEAGIGSIKSRAHHEAARHGRPGEWTCDDVEAAVLQANETARPQGRFGPTPKESWNERMPLLQAEREMFRRTYRRYYAQECSERGLPWRQHLQHYENASIDRVAIGRALIEHGFLLIRRKRVSLPIRSRRVKKIS